MSEEMKDGSSPVTVIGLGAMGAALAGAFLDRGHPTTVWNRSAEKGARLLAFVARDADDRDVRFEEEV